MSSKRKVHFNEEVQWMKIVPYKEVEFHPVVRVREIPSVEYVSSAGFSGIPGFEVKEETIEENQEEEGARKNLLKILFCPMLIQIDSGRELQQCLKTRGKIFKK